MKNPFRNISDKYHSIPEKRRRRFKVIAGVLTGAFALFTFIAVFSYFFTWKADMSLLGDPSRMSADVDAHNAASKLGYFWAHFLVGECFGVASIFFAAFLGAFSWKLVRKESGLDLLKFFAATLTGVFILSFALAFVGGYTPAASAFGGGLGGACGAVVTGWSINLFGGIMTGLLILILAFVWLLFTSERFSSSIIKAEGEEEEPEEPEQPLEPEEPEEPEEPSWQDDPEIPDEPEEPEEPEVPVEPGEGEDKPAVSGPIEVIIDDTLDQPVTHDLTPYDAREELPKYRFPSLSLLGDYEKSHNVVSQDEIERNNLRIRSTLESFHIQVSDVQAIVGPTVTLYKVFPAPGVKISTIRTRQEDISIALKARGVRVVTLSDSVGIEVANDIPSTVPLKKLLASEDFRTSEAELPVAIGFTITQKVRVFDLAEAPHLLVAGATKQGKSVGLNVIVSSLLYSKHPSELKFVFIDPKMVEFSSYGRLDRHYLASLPSAASEEEEKSRIIVKNPKDAAAVLSSLCVEMDERYELLSKAYVTKITLYNEKFKARKLLPTDGHRFLPYIVVVIDEYADLTMAGGAGPESKMLSRSITNSVIRLAQKGRAAGLHVILATQRPTVDVVTGLIKANFPWRIAFRVLSRVDSATILDTPGAEKLIGRGDMLFYTGIDMERIQCAFVSNEEVNSLTSFIGDQNGYKACFNTPYYLPEPPSESSEGGEAGSVDMSNLDERFREAATLIVTTQRGSTSDLQRRLGMGYAKAGRVMDQLESAGIVGPQEGSKPRQVLVKDLNELNELLSHFGV
ncbi:MAG: DNA translocase FtsK 4TM domain-containing protein [Bacteroidales bacterium]|nr:DNA translocase FtsK 4TM domain-containing protein [Bacteroidales bacterium]